jgi:hypothetical protein
MYSYSSPPTLQLNPTLSGRPRSLDLHIASPFLFPNCSRFLGCPRFLTVLVFWTTSYPERTRFLGGPHFLDVLVSAASWPSDFRRTHVSPLHFCPPGDEEAHLLVLAGIKGLHQVLLAKLIPVPLLLEV